MKISSLKINYLKPTYTYNEMNIQKLMHQPMTSYVSKADMISFEGKTFTLEESMHINNVDTGLYIGKKDSVADYVKAKSVLLEDGARIKHLVMKNYMFFSPPEFPENVKKYISNEDIVMLDNAQIDKLDDTKTNFKIAYVSRTEKPRIFKRLSNEQGKYDSENYVGYRGYNKVKNYDVTLFDYVCVGEIEAEYSKLLNNSRAHFINARDICIFDNAKSDTVIGKSVSIAHNAKVDKVNADNLGISDSSTINDATTKSAIVSGKSYVGNLQSNESIITDNAEVDNLTVNDSLRISKNAKVGNITVKGKKALVEISDNAQILGKVNFVNDFGVVTVIKGKNNEKPNVKQSQIVNGKLIRNFNTFGFEKVAGMKNLKETLYQDVIEPLTKPELYKQYGLQPINGCLLYGPPGCGKTYIANALAEEAGRYFVEVKLSEISSPLQNLTNVNLRKKFEEAEKHAPAIIFLDEIESLAPSRESLYGNAPETSERVTELLTLMNNCKEKNVFVICASNEPQKIDSAIKRSGRLDRNIYVGAPDSDTREEMFKMNLANRLTGNDIDYKLISKLTENYISSDILVIVDEAARFALKERKPISTLHLLQAIKQVQPSLTEREIEYYKNKLNEKND